MKSGLGPKPPSQMYFLNFPKVRVKKSKNMVFDQTPLKWKLWK